MFSNNLFASTTAKKNWPLSQLSTLGVGGQAEIFASPDSVKALQEIIRTAKNSPVYILGGGSNIIIPDGKINGLTISTRYLDVITWENNFTAEIGAGVKLSALLKILREKNLAGLEFATGIPGTLGGAIIGNAGAGGLGVCDFVDAVNVVDASGNLRIIERKDFSYSYRNCSLASEKIIIVSARMTFRSFTPDDDETSKIFMNKRKNQPVKFRCAGCTFKNPAEKSAGQLLDESGCKNLAVGGAIVSDQHANFILNRGNASSSDVLELIKICSQKVYDSTGIKLEPEIKLFSPCFCI